MLRGQVQDRCLGYLLLFIRIVKDRRTILRTNVVALAVQRCRIVDREEDLKQFGVSDCCWVECNSHNLGVAGGAGADGLVRWVCHRTAGVAGLHLENAFQLFENSFDAPETSAAEKGKLCGLVGSLIVHLCSSRLNYTRGELKDDGVSCKQWLVSSYRLTAQLKGNGRHCFAARLKQAVQTIRTGHRAQLQKV